MITFYFLVAAFFTYSYLSIGREPKTFANVAAGVFFSLIWPLAIVVGMYQSAQKDLATARRGT